MVEEILAARGIVVSHGTVRQWALKFGPLPVIATSSQQAVHR
jgi:transposase-like protein